MSSEPNKYAALAEQGLKAASDQPKPAEQSAPPAPPEPTRMLGGRVPDSIFKEFQYAKLDAESAASLRRVTTEEGIEALVRLLREDEVRDRWVELLKEVRQGRRG